jgi:hypothetical protein
MRHKVSHQQKKITEGPSSKQLDRFVVDVTVCPKAGCDVGCFPLLCVEKLGWKKAALSGCVDRNW